MKKYFSMLIILLLVFSFTPIYAEDIGVQVINEKTVKALSLNDMVLGETYKINGFARVIPLSCSFIDVFPQYIKGNAGDNSFSEWGSNNDPEEPFVRYGRYNWSFVNVCYFNSIQWVRSGTNAEFLCFLVDLVNLQKEPYQFMENCSVKVIFDNEYEYKGWIRQFNYDYDTYRAEDAANTSDSHPKVDEDYGTFIRAAIAPEDEEKTDMMYTGHYMVGCTLPNAVVIGKEPLRVEATLGNNIVTYHIRK